MAMKVITQLTETHIQDLQHMYESVWWAKGREIIDIEKMLAYSDVVLGVYDLQEHKLVGFARVLTDYVYRATIWDVVVAESYRGKGIGQTLIKEILEHPALNRVECFLLICLPDMIPYYEQFGFSDSSNRLQLMQKWSQRIPH